MYKQLVFGKFTGKNGNLIEDGNVYLNEAYDETSTGIKFFYMIRNALKNSYRVGEKRKEVREFLSKVYV